MPKPLNPYLVLLLAILLPGGGHVAVGEARRGLAFALFVVLFSFLTYLTTTPETSFLGRHAGGLFIWAMSIPDAYRRARLRFAMAAN
ncbi:MAG TPA: hypothetical protein VL202_24150 [Pararhizobium sp.]|uniref:hypothetical protein n=1 Tax=Pararhizobium sp. TaxID=1977563 RepID=UPI002BD46E29|nr:hypothetical protein [Pararhizobium sp.]HTO34236.1 hypothetical protein [Pararhizobium sp.]